MTGRLVSARGVAVGVENSLLAAAASKGSQLASWCGAGQVAGRVADAAGNTLLTFCP